MLTDRITPITTEGLLKVVLQLSCLMENEFKKFNIILKFFSDSLIKKLNLASESLEDAAGHVKKKSQRSSNQLCKWFEDDLN